MIHVRDIPLGGPAERAFPTAIAIPKAGGMPVVGTDALEASSTGYDLILNWKLLLGKTRAEISKERSNYAGLRRALDSMSLEQLAGKYFQSIITVAESQLGLIEHPQLIIGIPALSGEGAASWRSQYKRTVEAALKIAGYPKPAFFPEPFAVFQYHRNRGDIPEGKLHNVLIVDIGGGTTNVCMIQTTQHGRLARGGANHVPRAVRAIEVGGVI
jgi:molecular chaperone DnaK (HSP70)